MSLYSAFIRIRAIHVHRTLTNHLADHKPSIRPSSSSLEFPSLAFSNTYYYHHYTNEQHAVQEELGNTMLADQQQVRLGGGKKGSLIRLNE